MDKQKQYDNERCPGEWLTNEKGIHYFVRDGETPEEAWKRREETMRNNMSVDELKEQLQQHIPEETPVVKINLDADIQKRLDAANTSKERQKIAYRYIMDNLCGEYAAPDGRTITISSVGADKITHRDIEVKLRVSPSLADLIKTGEFLTVKDSDPKVNPKFVKFAYYKVTFQIGNDRYTGLLNVGIRADNSSTLYDLNPFNKQ